MAVITPRCAAFTAVIKARFPSAQFDGIYSCRHIIPHDGGGSSLWSEHSWGNAVDFGGSDATMQAIMAFAQQNQQVFHIDNIIGPGSAVNVVHVDFFPNHAGEVPPCAGGPNVTPPSAGPGATNFPTNGGNTTIDQYAAAGSTTAPSVGSLPGGIMGGVEVQLMKIARYGEVVLGGMMVVGGVLIAVAGMSGLADTAVGVAGRGVASNARSRITEPAARRRRAIISDESIRSTSSREAARRETVGYTASQRRATQAAAGEQARRTAEARETAKRETATTREVQRRTTTQERYAAMAKRDASKSKKVTRISTKGKSKEKAST